MATRQMELQAEKEYKEALKRQKEAEEAQVNKWHSYRNDQIHLGINSHVTLANTNHIIFICKVN